MWKKVLFGAGLFTVLSGSLVTAQSPDHVLTIDDGDLSCSGSTTLELPVTYDNLGSSSVMGWSFGVGHDPAVLQLDGVVDGSTTVTVDGGDPPVFNQVNLYIDGYTVGVVISFRGMNPLPPGQGYELSIGTYFYGGSSGSSTEVCFTGTLGSPPVTTVVVVDGQSVTPVQNCGVIQTGFALCLPGFIYGVADVTAPTHGSFTTTCSIEDGTGSGSDTQGFSMAMANDPDVIQPVQAQPVGVLASLGGGSGPDFFGDTYYPEAWTVGVVYSFRGGAFIAFEVPLDVVAVTYDVVGAPAAGDTTDLEWSGAVGSPPVANVVVVAGASVFTTPYDGIVTFGPSSLGDATLLRGDCNDDGLVDIADGVWLLSDLFLAGPPRPCAATGDLNADGVADASDAVILFLYCLLDGSPPVAPFPDCGLSGLESDGLLGCGGSSCP